MITITPFLCFATALIILIVADLSTTFARQWPGKVAIIAGFLLCSYACYLITQGSEPQFPFWVKLLLAAALGLATLFGVILMEAGIKYVTYEIRIRREFGADGQAHPQRIHRAGEQIAASHCTDIVRKEQLSARDALRATATNDTATINYLNGRIDACEEILKALESARQNH